MKLKWLKDKLGEKFYPIAHATGVVVTENKTLDSKLTEIDKDIKDNGYGEVAGGKNLVHNTINGATALQFNYALTGIANIPKGVKVTISFIGSSGNRVYNDTNLLIPTFICTGKKQSFTATTQEEIKGKFVIFKNGENNTVVPNFSEVQIELGSESTSYEPYFPSNKMIGEEAIQQSTEIMDIKMLGWSVPRECPVQNEVNGNQFIQKVGRVDSSTLDWSYQTENTRFIASIPSDMKQTAGTRVANIMYLYGYKTISDGSDIGSISNKSIYISNNMLVIHDSAYTDASAFRSAMQGQYLYYKLATPITTTIDGNEIGETVSDMRKETTVNLFKPTLETTTQNGITVTNNGDGTYAVTGTATDTTELILGSITLTPGIYKNIGATAYIKKTDGSYVKTIHNEEFTITEDSPVVTPILFYNSSEAISGTIIIKPMITTNLNATIDDFVPYTGDTGQLNKDVAELRSDVDGLGDDLVTGRIQLLANFTSDYYRYIEPVAGKNQILVPPIIVNGTSTSFDSSGGDEVSGSNYSYAPRESVKMDILDVEVSSSLAQGGITVKFLDKRSDLSKLYNVNGTATSDIEIPLYSVNEPKNSYLYFVTDSVRKMSSGTFYIKISDSSGNETTLGTDGSKSLKTYLKKHNGKVTVYLVVKSGITVKQYVNVKCGYSSSDCIADFSPRKYSDTIDNVIDAILDLNNRLKVLENK